jgi:hypothetical protein
MVYSNRSASELNEMLQTSTPVLNDFIDDKASLDSFIERLKELKAIRIINDEKSELRTFHALFDENEKPERIVLVLASLSNNETQLNE